MNIFKIEVGRKSSPAFQPHSGSSVLSLAGPFFPSNGFCVSLTKDGHGTAISPRQGHCDIQCQMMTADEVQVSVEDDGLVAPEVGRWAEEKYRLISLYDELFASGMKYKWDQRVYIDLYSAAGISRIKGTDTFPEGFSNSSL